ncbi:MAG TPA: M20/M25/M40 family metallo-hydrolase [Steroidobacteraceae bacterium]|nr:M20/M25/M40 family metallo-hydrolase [Steroidobacteraceae bacterium]
MLPIRAGALALAVFAMGAAGADAPLAAELADAAELPQYTLEVRIEPDTHHLAVDATLGFPAQYAGRDVEFLLAAPLAITASTPAIERLPAGDTGGFTGINGSSAALEKSGRAARYRVTLPKDSPVLRLSYAGAVDFGFDTPEEEYARGFSETAGVIGAKGVYLAGSSLWYPYLGDTLFVPTVHATAPEGWHLITVDPAPVDELPLVGGPLTRYAESVGAVEAQVFLRTPDEALARKYLDATARDLEMYRQLIGPYPYSKFALVENFWETGYGMPSFTLLGPQIIRFPFILTSSYPHEILHNWWGNSVFVDYATGNWCEGLTAYMADHLFKEQLGQGAEYRRDTLKRYRDYVKDAHDFPLNEFRSRHSAATEAVGYGKTLMGFHMLRRQLGDDAFRKALQSLYRNQRGQRASFTDVRHEFEKAGGVDLATFFTQWVDRAGAADLRLEDVRADGNGVRGVIRQVQRTGLLDIEVPVSVRTANGYTTQVVRLQGAATPFSIALEAEPQLLELDPEFDVFRLLDPRETAPSIGQVFGDTAVLAVLPARAGKADQQLYRDMLARWVSPAQQVEVRLDTEVDELPADRAAWIFGRENRYAAQLLKAAAEVEPALAREDVNVTFVQRHPGNPAKAVGFIALGSAVAAPGLAGKLPHYGKYSYLVFEGDEPKNTVKGEWSAVDSPLRIDLRSAQTPLAPLAHPSRAPLATLPPVFNAQKLAAHVAYLAAPERDGRGLGTRGLEEAAEYIVKAFTEAGLAPGGDEGGWLQAFAESANVIGVLAGANPAFAGQAIVVSAHYDHLGPNHPGADDNASGVAVLIELARALASQAAPPRTIVFAAFSGEESGLLGSRWYAAHPTPVPLAGIRANVNLDTVGRLGSGPVRVIATGTASEWPPIFRGVGFTTGIAIQNIEGAGQSSDQQAFIERGIPGVQLFAGASLDYHKPTDTLDKVDVAGMVKVATVAKEAIEYLAARPEPLTATISATAAAPVQPPAGTPRERRASLGIVPDFAYTGRGVRAEGIVPDSPAAKAALQPGDVLLTLAGQPIDDMQAYSNVLKTLEVGALVTVEYRRGEALESVKVELGAR